MHFLRGYKRYTDNDISGTVPQWWARQALRLLDKKTRILPLVNRDYNEAFAEAGDIVNLTRHGSFVAMRKFENSPISIQDVRSSRDWVALNQQLHVSFLLTDQELRRSFDYLTKTYILRAAIALAEGIDAVLMGESYQFMGAMAGAAGATITDDSILELREHFVRNNAPGLEDGEGRYLLVGAGSESQMLGVSRFVEMSTIGDGSPLRTGMIGRIRGFDVIQTSQAWEVPANSGDVTLGAVNKVGGYAAGVDTLTVDGFTGALTVGSWLTIAGDMRPRRIVDTTETAGDTTEIELSTPIDSSVANDAVITVWNPVLVDQAEETPNQASGYDFQYGGDLVIDGFTNPLKLGQGVCIGATGDAFYTVIATNITENSITLNRPLDAGVLNNAPIFPLPRANYNMAINRDAITFVNRQLMPPEPGTGVKSYTATYKGVAIRVTIGYDMTYERQRVTLSTLCGVKTLNRDMGAILIS